LSRVLSAELNLRGWFLVDIFAGFALALIPILIVLIYKFGYQVHAFFCQRRCC